MPRESTITVLRSTTTDVPTGLTFGEIAYSDLNGKFHIGKNDGTSLWIGAQITAGDITNNSQYIVPTQSAVKSYVDGAIGGGAGVVNTVNATGGAITITGDGGALFNTQVAKTNTVGVRLATTGVTGVASFNSTYFSVASGAVSLATAYQATGDSVQAGSGIAISANKTITNIGVTSLNGLTGSTTLTGDGGSLVGVGNTNFTNRLATTGVTGVASFNSSHFTVSSGAVSSNGITVKASSADGGTTLNLGGTLTITGTVNQVSVSRSNTDFTIGLPNDITIPGNLTVNGTVVTANVDSFIVEDPLIMLGTGNAADSVDLGFYGQYTSGGKRFAGIYRDASDSGKFKFFTGLSGGVEPTTFVNDSGSGYTVATIVAKIDGGTF